MIDEENNEIVDRRKINVRSNDGNLREWKEDIWCPHTYIHFSSIVFVSLEMRTALEPSEVILLMAGA